MSSSSKVEGLKPPQPPRLRRPWIRSDEGLTLETSAFNLFTVANLPFPVNTVF